MLIIVINYNLNTSYVDIKPKAWKKGFVLLRFKYILC